MTSLDPAPTPDARGRAAPGAAALRLVTALALSAASSLAAFEATAGPRTGLEDGDARKRGALLFQMHCASCHGEDGRGEGHLAQQLEISPPDLTSIAVRNDGRFPAAELGRVIDGRAELETHRKREMPIWGLTFQQAGRDSDQGLDVEARVADLVAFLRAIQRWDS